MRFSGEVVVNVSGDVGFATIALFFYTIALFFCCEVSGELSLFISFRD